MAEISVIGEKKNNIYYLTLNRPQKRNAISIEMLEEFCETVNFLAKDPEIRVIIVKGEGSVFSAGIDFNSLGQMAGTYLSDAAGGGAPIRADIHQAQQWLNRLEAIEIPIICAMHGGVYGLGMEVALACDIRLMSEDCTWGLPEARGGGLEEIIPLISGEKCKNAWQTGDVDTAPMMVGQSIGLIHSVPTCVELLETMMAEAEERLQAVNAQVKNG
jgi:enoyl-CoA hydratase/carnithine racemase